MPFKLLNKPQSEEYHEVPYEMRRERLGTQMTQEELQEIAKVYGGQQRRAFYQTARYAQTQTNPHEEIEALGKQLGLLPIVQGTAATIYDALAPKRGATKHRVTNKQLATYAIVVAIKKHGLNIRTNTVIEAARRLGWTVSLSDILRLQLDLPVSYERQTIEDLQSIVLKGLVKEGYITPQEYAPLLEEGRAIAKDVRFEGKTPQTVAAASIWRLLQRKTGKKIGPVEQKTTARLAGTTEYQVRAVVDELRKAGYELEGAYERDIKKQTSMDGFIAPLESYGPPVVEEKKPFIPVKMVQPMYRLEEELKKRGYTKEHNRSLWRYGPPRGKFAELVPWEGEAFVKRKGDSFARVWLAPFGEVDSKGLPVTGKWSGYMYILPERLKISAGVKDSQDQAVDTLLETEARNWGVTKEAFRERQQKEFEERQKAEFMAKYPTEESARKHDIDLIYKAMGTTPMLLPPAVKEAIGRLLGEYVQRATHEGMIGTPHVTEADVDDFLARYDNEIREEAKKIGPWPGQKAAPMGSWKEKWRPLVKKHFKEWYRVHYGTAAKETETSPPVDQVFGAIESGKMKPFRGYDLPGGWHVWIEDWGPECIEEYWNENNVKEGDEGSVDAEESRALNQALNAFDRDVKKTVGRLPDYDTGVDGIPGTQLVFWKERPGEDWNKWTWHDPMGFGGLCSVRPKR